MRYQNAKADDLPKYVLDAVQSAIEKNKGLFFYGDTGVGKTHALHAISKNKSNVDNFPILLVEFRDYMQKGFYLENIKEYTNRDYIFIDDIGSEKVSEFVVEFLYILVNRRYENMKRTVLSTNLSIEAFQEKYGDRIMSRIAEMCVLVEIRGEDKRLQ